MGLDKRGNYKRCRALIMASATPVAYFWAKTPHHQIHRVIEDSGCHPEWPKVADAVIEARCSSII